MFLVIAVILMVCYHTMRPQAPAGELWFMMAAFVALSYVGGFLDSRLFARLDQSAGARLPDHEGA